MLLRAAGAGSWWAGGLARSTAAPRRTLSIIANEKQANARKTVAVGVSGGVDSAVTAFLLKKQGYNVIAVHMTNWDASNDDTGTCSAEVDADDAEQTAKQLGLPFRHVNLVENYWNRVWETCIEDWERGWNPNPDVLCNREIKFATFRQRVLDSVDADYFATGHYGRLLRLRADHFAQPNLATNTQEGIITPSQMGLGLDHPVDLPPGSTYAQLFKASTEAGRKDQSYFLSAVPLEGLQDVIFPIGDLPKSAVRQIAKELRLKVAQKKDSTGICFIGERDFPEFIQQYIQPRPGVILCKDTGLPLGMHKGGFIYTIGQRISMGGLLEKYYVVEKNNRTNEVFAVRGQFHPNLYSVSLRARRTHWLLPPETVAGWPLDPEGPGVRFRYMVSYLGHESVCTVRRLPPPSPAEVAAGTRDPLDELEVQLDLPHRAVAPGQTVVFYLGDACVGSAQISGVITADQTELGRNPDGSLRHLDPFKVTGINP